MQLLLILAVLFLSSKNADVLPYLKPIAESFGGDEIKEVLKNAEEISTALSALTPSAPNEGTLDKVKSFASEDITYSLSQYLNGVS